MKFINLNKTNKSFVFELSYHDLCKLEDALTEYARVLYQRAGDRPYQPQVEDEIDEVVSYIATLHKVNEDESMRLARLE